MTENKPTLVILAAGMGSRYGGLKQIDSFTPEGDTIIDFSLYDALEAGFTKFVFIIRKSFEKEFKEIFNKKLEGKAEVVYVYQELDAVPEQYINHERTKPWGTGHAMLMCKEVVKENFAIINADDFYGREAFVTMSKFLNATPPNSYDFSMVAYLLKNTVSEYGHVSRGECKLVIDSYLLNITEKTHIEKKGDTYVYTDDSGNETIIDGNTTVSMNFWGFTPKCFEFGQQLFVRFLEDNKENIKAEFYLPTIVNDILKSGKATVKALKSEAKWFGVTYSEDKPRVQEAITQLREQGVYPKKLWNHNGK